jgi:two-component system KDP operon response regulator KdpE
VLSGNGDESTIVQVLDRGADDYLTKPFRSGELLARMRALLRRASTQPERSSVVVAGELSIDLAKRKVLRDGNEIRLTRTEFDIVAFLGRNLDRVVTAEMILRQVWGPHHGEYAQTLRVHIGHIRRKIERDPAKPDYVLTQAGVGYRFSTPSEESDAAEAAGV